MMKKIWLLILMLGINVACEDVIDVDLSESEPKLVIEASINLLEDGTSVASVILTRTAPFFDQVIPPVTDASVKITDESGIVYPFLYSENGIYQGNLIPQPQITYSLEVIDNGEIYTASAQLVSVPTLEFVEQNDEGGFSGEEIELKVYFTDPGDEANYYFFEGLSARGDVRDTFNDEFFNGNLIFGFYYVEDLNQGDDVVFNLYGVDTQFYNFMYVLLQQSTDQSGGPFETQPATVRGNIINETRPDNFPLGYFRISEMSTLTYTVE
jgi:hypothetical protein